MDDEKLISLVQMNTFLYDKTATSFKQKDAREEAWKAISKELEMPVDVCTRRWNTLRERFSREVRKYPPPGSGNGVRYTWHLFSAMMFLQPFVKPRRSRCSTNVLAYDSPAQIPIDTEMPKEMEFVAPSSPAATCYENKSGYLSSPQYISDSSSENHLALEFEQRTTFGSRKRKESSVDRAILEALGHFKKVCQHQMETKNTAVDCFGRMITAIVNDMSDAKQTKAIKEVTALVMAIKEETE